MIHREKKKKMLQRIKHVIIRIIIEKNETSNKELKHVIQGPQSIKLAFPYLKSILFPPSKWHPPPSVNGNNIKSIVL